MAKAKIELQNGTVVTVEGTTDEVSALLEFYGTSSKVGQVPVKKSPSKSPRKDNKTKDIPAPDGKEVNHAQIVNLVKDCDEAEAIETQILDRSSQVNRTLLPLYIVHEHLNNAYGVTSGDVTKITTDLGIPISGPNASRTLSGTASKYVIGDVVKVKGRAVRYKLSRRGVKYIHDVLSGSKGD